MNFFFKRQEKMWKVPLSERSNLFSYQPHRFVVHFNVLLIQRNLLNLECDTSETQLSGNVHPSQLHVHGYDLHGTYTSVI